MRLLDLVFQAAVQFQEMSQINEYLELRQKVQKDCAGGWDGIRKMELKRWNQFGGIPYALSIMRQNLTYNQDLPQIMRYEIEQLIKNEDTKKLDIIAKDLANFVDKLTPYILNAETDLDTGNIKLSSILRRSLLDIKACFLGLDELIAITSVIAPVLKAIKGKTEEFEREMVKRNIGLPISPESYSLILEIAGSGEKYKKALVAGKQIADMVKIIQQLIFNTVVYKDSCTFTVGTSTNLQYEELSHGRIVRCQMLDVPPPIPGQIFHFMGTSLPLPLYVAILSFKWHFDGQVQSSKLDLEGIDLEGSGPNLLERLATYGGK